MRIKRIIQYSKKAIEKYGWDNFKHEIILDNISKSEADYAEKYLIKWYKLHKMSYNITDGGEGNLGINHSEETKKKMSDSAKGRKPSIQTIEASKKAMANLTEEQRKKRFGHPGIFKGVHRSEETKAKISAAAKGRDMSNVIKAGIQSRKLKSIPIIVTKNGEFVGEFDLLSEACDKLNINRSNAHRALHRGLRAKGYSFDYKNIEQ